MASTNKSNPQVRTTFIGVRTLRKVNIYPLSLKDQLDLSDLIIESFNKFNSITSDAEKSDRAVFAEVVNFVITLIQENIADLVDKIMDEGDDQDYDVLSDITNDQAFEIGKIVYEANFESILKNVRSLFEENTAIFDQQSKRPLQQSAKPTGAIGSSTSSVEDTKKVVSRTKK